MKYDKSTILSTTEEFIQLSNVSVTYRKALRKYTNYSLGQFLYDYFQHLNGRPVYDQLMLEIAPDMLLTYGEELPVTKKLIKDAATKYSIEDLSFKEKRVLPYVSNIHLSIGKLMDEAISQAISLTINHPHKQVYGKALQMFFNEHLDRNEIAKRLNVSTEHVRTSLIGNLIEGGNYVESISIDESFKNRVIDLVNPMLYCACDRVFEDNDIDTQEKRDFACALAAKDFFNNMKEWGNAFVVVEKDSILLTKQHLISLKLAICDAIVPVKLQDLIERTKSNYVKKNDPKSFNCHIIESFVNSHPWIKKDDEGRYYILTPYLKKDYQRQGRIIYEENGLIHYREVKDRYESIYGETYKSNGVQLRKLKSRPEQDFYPYGRTGLWYYSENGSQLIVPNKSISRFVDEKVEFYWKDLVDVVNQLLRVNPNLTKRRIRLEVTNLCYTEKANSDHFVKKGEEEKYPDFSWNKGRQTRTNWVINHAYELLKDVPDKRMLWTDFEKQFKDDIIETGRPLKVLEELKYKHSGADKKFLFIRENDYIGVNEEVLQNKYNGDLSMVGKYRKHPEYYDSIFALAMTELRKRPDNTMALTDFIAYAVNHIDSEDRVDSRYIRNIFDNNDNLPKGLSRFNQEGSVYIKLDLVIADADTKDDVQYEVKASSAEDSQTVPELVESDNNRLSITSATRFDWADVKKALQSDLYFYESPSWYPGITSDAVLDKFVQFLSTSTNYNLNNIVPQIVYEFHYARINRYDLNQYMRNLPIAFEALLREIYESSHSPIKTNGIKSLCENGFTDFDEALKHHDKKGFGRILNDLVYKRNLLVHGTNLELSIVTLNQNIVEYIALFVYTFVKYVIKHIK